MNYYNDSQEYVNRYRELCSELNTGTNKEDIKKHNLAMKKLGNLFHQLKQQEDKSFALGLLCDEDISVSSIIAAHCLGWGVYKNEAKKVLKKISRTKNNPLIAFDAEMTLKVYQMQGYLDF